MSEPIVIRPLPASEKASLTLSLPWPASDLSPNDHQIWRAKDRSRKEAIGVGKYLTLEALGSRELELRGELELTLYFYPPDRRWVDLDNLIARMKHYQDGICRALGVDDHRITKRTEEIVAVDLYHKGTVTVILRER